MGKTYIQVSHFLAQRNYFLGAVDIDAHSKCELFVEANCGGSVKDQVDILRQNQTVLSADAKSRQNAVASNSDNLISKPWLFAF